MSQTGPPAHTKSTCISIFNSSTSCLSSARCSSCAETKTEACGTPLEIIRVIAVIRVIRVVRVTRVIRVIRVTRVITVIRVIRVIRVTRGESKC